MILKTTILLLAVLLIVSGCGIQPSTEATKKIQEQVDAAAVQHAKDIAEIQSLKDAGEKVLQGKQNGDAIIMQNGKSLPAFHPLAGTNQIVLELHPIAKIATTGLSAAALGIWIASFFFSAMTFLPNLAIALTKAAVLALAVLISLNFIVWGLAILIGGFAVVWLIDSIKNHWDQGKTFINILSMVGMKWHGQTPVVAVADAKASVKALKIPESTIPPVTA